MRRGQRTEKTSWSCEQMEQSMSWKSYVHSRIKLCAQCLYPAFLLSVVMGIMYLINMHQHSASASSTSSVHCDQLYGFPQGWSGGIDGIMSGQSTSGHSDSVQLRPRDAPAQALFAKPMPRERVGRDNAAKTSMVQQQQQHAQRSDLLSVRSRVEGASLDIFLDACLGMCRSNHVEMRVDMHTAA